MDVHLSPLRYLAVVSVCFLLALFTVLPECYACPDGNDRPIARQAALRHLQHRDLFEQQEAESGLHVVQLAFPLERQSRQRDRESWGLAKFDEILDRLRRIFWTLAQRFERGDRAESTLALLDAGLSQKGEDMLEGAA